MGVKGGERTVLPSLVTAPVGNDTLMRGVARDKKQKLQGLRPPQIPPTSARCYHRTSISRWRPSS